MIGVLHDRHPSHARDHLLEHLEPFLCKRMFKDGETSDIAARASETCDKAVAHRISDKREHKRDGLGLALQRREGPISAHRS